MVVPKSNSNADFIAAETQLVSGMLKHKAGLPPTMTLVGQSYTPDEAAVILQARIAAASAVAPAKAAYAKVVLANRTERAETDEFVRDLKALLILTNKTSPEVLADCGLALKKKATRTPAMKVVAAAKGQVTRTLRHTKSAKAKAAIKGALAGPVVITDTAAPQTAAPAATATAPHALVAVAGGTPPEGTTR